MDLLRLDYPLVHTRGSSRLPLFRLEREGFVERYRSPEDRRLSIARITKKGLHLLDEMDEEIRGVRRRYLGDLAERDCAELSQLCAAVYTEA